MGKNFICMKKLNFHEHIRLKYRCFRMPVHKKSCKASVTCSKVIMDFNEIEGQKIGGMRIEFSFIPITVGILEVFGGYWISNN